MGFFSPHAVYQADIAGTHGTVCYSQRARVLTYRNSRENNWMSLPWECHVPSSRGQGVGNVPFQDMSCMIFNWKARLPRKKVESICAGLVCCLVPSGMSTQIARFMGPIWGRQDPGGPHVGHMNFAIWETTSNVKNKGGYINVYIHTLPWHLFVVVS